MHIIGITNNKGGVGKTTIAVNLSSWLARKHKVLLIDTDSQNSASLSLGLARTPGLTIADVLLNNESIKDAIRNTKIKNLDIIIAHKDISLFDQRFANDPDKNIKLKQQVSKVKDLYDYILIDSAPSLNLLNVNVLTSADKLIIPVTPDYLSLEGLGLLMNLIDPKEPYRILLSMVDHRLRITEEVITFIRKQFKDKVFYTEIRQNVKLKEAPSYYQSIFDYDSQSAGADCFERLGREVMRWLS